jgi:hypothetical protein
LGVIRYNKHIDSNKQELNMTVKRFKQAQRFRVIVGAACFYATAKQIRSGLGDFTTCNAAVQKALDALEFYRSGTGVESACTGHAGTWEGLAVQLNVA